MNKIRRLLKELHERTHVPGRRLEEITIDRAQYLEQIVRRLVTEVAEIRRNRRSRGSQL